MVGADVMTTIIQLFNKFFGSDVFDWSKKQKSEIISKIYINSCRLLTNLWYYLLAFILILNSFIAYFCHYFSGTSDKSMKILNNSDITQILINGLKAFETNIELSIASGLK